MFSMKDQKASLVVMFILQDQKDKKEGKNYNLPPLGNAFMGDESSNFLPLHNFVSHKKHKCWSSNFKTSKSTTN